MTKRFTKPNMRQWLAERPGEYVTAYKAVALQTCKAGKNVGKRKMFPTIFNRNRNSKPNFFKRKNYLLSTPLSDDRKSRYLNYDTEAQATTQYIAYFHFCTTRKTARGWCRGDDNAIVVKCKIPKSAITDIGKQGGETVIIAKRFEIVDEKAEIYL